jgi:hypothetical protein
LSKLTKFVEVTIFVNISCQTRPSSTSSTPTHAQALAFHGVVIRMHEVHGIWVAFRASLFAEKGGVPE